MASPPPRPRNTPAGGALIAIGALTGTAIGFFFGEVTPGFLIGLGTGIAASLLIWARNR